MTTKPSAISTQNETALPKNPSGHPIVALYTATDTSAADVDYLLLENANKNNHVVNIDESHSLNSNSNNTIISITLPDYLFTAESINESSNGNGNQIIAAATTSVANELVVVTKEPISSSISNSNSHINNNKNKDNEEDGQCEAPNCCALDDKFSCSTPIRDVGCYEGEIDVAAFSDDQDDAIDESECREFSVSTSINRFNNHARDDADERHEVATPRSDDWHRRHFATRRQSHSQTKQRQCAATECVTDVAASAATSPLAADSHTLLNSLLEFEENEKRAAAAATAAAATTANSSGSRLSLVSVPACSPTPSQPQQQLSAPIHQMEALLSGLRSQYHYRSLVVSTGSERVVEQQAPTLPSGAQSSLLLPLPPLPMPLMSSSVRHLGSLDRLYETQQLQHQHQHQHLQQQHLMNQQQLHQAPLPAPSQQHQLHQFQQQQQHQHQSHVSGGFFRKHDHLMALESRLESEIFRRQHCEKQIHELNEHLLELQQQLAVANGLDKKRELLAHNMDSALQKILENWKQRELEVERTVRHLTSDQQRSAASESRMVLRSQFMEQELKKLSDELIIEKVKSQEYYAEIVKLRSDLNQADKANYEKKTKLEESERSESELRSQRDTLATQLSEQQDQFAQVKKQKQLSEHALIAEIEQLKLNNQHLMRQNEKLKTDYDQLIKEAKLVVDESEKQYGELCCTIEAEKMAKDSLRVQMNMLEEQHELELKALTEECTTKITTVQSAVKERERTSHEQHSVELEQLRVKSRVDAEKLRTKCQTDLQSTINEYEMKLTDLKLKMDSLRSDIERLQRSNKDLEAERNTIRQNLKHMLELQMKETMQLLGIPAAATTTHLSHSSGDSGALLLEQQRNSNAAALFSSANNELVAPKLSALTDQQPFMNEPNSASLLPELLAYSSSKSSSLTPLDIELAATSGQRRTEQAADILDTAAEVNNISSATVAETAASTKTSSQKLNQSNSSLMNKSNTESKSNTQLLNISATNSSRHSVVSDGQTNAVSKSLADLMLSINQSFAGGSVAQQLQQMRQSTCDRTPTSASSRTAATMMNTSHSLLLNEADSVFDSPLQQQQQQQPNSPIAIKDEFILNQIDLINKYYQIDDKTIEAVSSSRSASALNLNNSLGLPSLQAQPTPPSALSHSYSISTKNNNNESITNAQRTVSGLLTQQQTISNAPLNRSLSHSSQLQSAVCSTSVTTAAATTIATTRATELRHYIGLLLNRSPEVDIDLNQKHHHQQQQQQQPQHHKTGLASSSQSCRQQKTPPTATASTLAQLDHQLDRFKRKSMQLIDDSKVVAAAAAATAATTTSTATEISHRAGEISDGAPDKLVTTITATSSRRTASNESSTSAAISHLNSSGDESSAESAECNAESGDDDDDSSDIGTAANQLRFSYDYGKHNISDLELGYTKRQSFEYYDDVKRNLKFDDDDDDDNDDDNNNDEVENQHAATDDMQDSSSHDNEEANEDSERERNSHTRSEGHETVVRTCAEDLNASELSGDVDEHLEEPNRKIIEPNNNNNNNNKKTTMDPRLLRINKHPAAQTGAPRKRSSLIKSAMSQRSSKSHTRSTSAAPKGAASRSSKQLTSATTKQLSAAALSQRRIGSSLSMSTSLISLMSACNQTHSSHNSARTAATKAVRTQTAAIGTVVSPGMRRAHTTIQSDLVSLNHSLVSSNSMVSLSVAASVGNHSNTTASSVTSNMKAAAGAWTHKEKVAIASAPPLASKSAALTLGGVVAPSASNQSAVSNHSSNTRRIWK